GRDPRGARARAHRADARRRRRGVLRRNERRPRRAPQGPRPLLADPRSLAGHDARPAPPQYERNGACERPGGDGRRCGRLRGIDLRHRGWDPDAVWNAALRQRRNRGPGAHVLRDGRRDGGRGAGAAGGRPPRAGAARPRHDVQPRPARGYEGGRARAGPRRSARSMRILAIGSALRDVCGDQAALGLTFVEEARTAPKYRLYSIGDTHAALVEDAEHGISVPGEIVEVPDDRWEEILASEPPGVRQAPVELLDGRVVTAAVGDPRQMDPRASEITEYGGFAAYLRARRSASRGSPAAARLRRSC